MSEVKLFNGDCIDQMQRLIEDNVKVDLVVTSPPYDNLRTFIGIELDKEYFKIAEQRIKEAKAQRRLI